MLSHDLFKDRTSAGTKLASRLSEFKDTNAMVLALPRGGVVTGAEVARLLSLPLDIIVTRKIGAPDNPEYAIGAIDQDCQSVWSESEILHIDQAWLKDEIAKEHAEAIRRVTKYRGTRTPLNLHNKTVIIVDDGMATGLTMKAAVHFAKKSGAKAVIIAIPVAPLSTVKELEKEAEVRVLETPTMFFSVGQFYDSFPQVTDNEVISLLS